MPEPIRIESRPQGMVTLRGELGNAALAKAIKAATGCAVPGPREILHGKAGSVAWMSPDELLLLVPHDGVPAIVAALDAALAGHHHLALDVSDARALIRLCGKGVRDVLAKGAPIDLAPDRFGPGMIRRSRIGLLAAAFWMPEPDCFEIVCFRSLASYMEIWLRHAARPGSAPGVFAE